MLAFAREFWQVLAEMAPYLLFGFLVAGLLAAWVPATLIERHLGGRGWWPALKASLLGIPLPICSCGVIPVAASLRKHGASRGATTSFLLSTPQTGVDSILVTLSLLGPLYAVYRPFAALVTGVLGGVVTDAIERNGPNGEPVNDDKPVCTDGCCSPGPKEPALKRIWNFGFITLPRDIGKSLVIGLLIAAVISVVVPEGYISSSLGGVWAMLAMLALSIPMYVCATASVPVAAALMVAGISPGAALVFLVAGPATNAATITTLWKILGPRATIVYLTTVAVGAFLGGWALNGLFAVTKVPQLHHGMFMFPAWFNNGSAIALILLLIYTLWPRRKKVQAMDINPDQQQTVFSVQGMDCQHCVASVERALSAQSGVSKVQVDLGSGTATVVGNGYDSNSLIEVIGKLGYKAQRD